MHEQSPERPTLTDMQRTRIDFARRDLEAARATDLHDLPIDGLILLLDTMRGRLTDTIGVIDEITSTGGTHLQG